MFILPYFVEQPPTNVTASVGGNATIKCNAESFPPPTFQWQKFDGTNFVTLSGQENSSLELTSVTADDLGQYRCVVLTEELDPKPIISNISTLYGMLCTFLLAWISTIHRDKILYRMHRCIHYYFPINSITSRFSHCTAIRVDCWP